MQRRRGYQMPATRARRSPATLLWLGAIALGGAALSGCLGQGGARQSSAQPKTYSVSMTGSMPPLETVGSPVAIQLHVANAADALPRLVLVIDGLGDSWTVRQVTGCGHAAVAVPWLNGTSPAWDFGPLGLHATCDISYHLLPAQVTAGQSSISVRIFANLDQDGNVDATTAVNGGAELAATIQ